MDFTPVITNPGYGGAVFATDSFTQDSVVFVMPFTGVAFSTDGGVTYTPVGEGGAALPINITKIGGGAITLGPSGLSVSIPVVTPRASSSTVTQVSVSVTSVTLLNINTSRIGASIYNYSEINLFLKSGATASLSSFTCKITPNTYYELPYGDTGRYDAIWESAGSGSALVTQWE